MHVRAGLVFTLLLPLCAALPASSQDSATPQTPAPAPAPATIQAVPAQTSAETESVHILIGRSIIVTMQARLRKVYVSNPAVVESTTTSPNQVVVTAKGPGSSNVVFWDEDGRSRMLEVSADVDIAGFRDALQLTYPNQPIEARAEEGRVILSGTVTDKDIADNVYKMAQNYSKDVVDAILVHVPPHGKQIMLKVRFAEVDRGKMNTFGINILSTGAGNTPGIITTQQYGTISNTAVTGTIGGSPQGTTSSFNVGSLLNIFLFRPDLNLGATIEDLETKNVLQILAEPDLMAISGEPAHFLAGGEFPYPVVQGTSAGGAGAVTIQFRPFGIRLDFTGTIEPDNSIRLKVAPEVSSLDYGNGITISGFTVPALSTRHAETTVELKDGQSFGIAGLLDSNTTIQMSKIPGIGDIPILGQIFHSHSKNLTSSELLVVVTPTIVDPLGIPTAVPLLPKPVVPALDPNRFDQHFPGSHQVPGTATPVVQR
ncbi:MAG TPA: pilus assembly protein N-terminal domain-containing protein [Edaphobacter sp.]|nr:pilus assembly protein N-terminal domain-containing protein [Edaphobacter sp.]